MPNMNLRDVYRSSDVTRWGIVKVARNQSVAEHSFQVAMIASRICDLMGEHHSFKDNVVALALVHDLPEVITGDLASPLKGLLGDEARHRLEEFEASITVLGHKVPQRPSKASYVVKAADLIEAIAFLDQNAMTDHGSWVQQKLREDLDRRAKLYPSTLRDVIKQVLYEILHGEETTLDMLGELSNGQ